jgi:hypothetical protein
MACHRVKPERGFAPPHPSGRPDPRRVPPPLAGTSNAHLSGVSTDPIQASGAVEVKPDTSGPLPPDAFIFRSSGLMDAFQAIKARAADIRRMGQ